MLRILSFIPSGMINLAAAISKTGIFTFIFDSSLGKLPALLIETYSLKQVLESSIELKAILAIIAVFILFVYLFNKRKKERKKETKLIQNYGGNNMKHFKWIVSVTLISVILAACTDNETQNRKNFEEVKDVKIEHIHGLGYAGNRDDLYFATHDGLVRYSDNKWYEITQNKHDYMGFQAVDTGFYSSGHPEPGSDLKNPLGLIKSTDEGKSFKKLAFYGETDFHYMSAGFNSHMIYAINETPNSKLDSGLYYSKDEGKTWTQSKMQGFSASSIGNIATHPTKPNIIGVSTDKGLYFSDNNGDQFKVVSKAVPITTLEFEEESMLYFAMDGDNPALYKQDLATQNVTKLSVPNEVNSKNPIMFIASNPKNRDEITVITYKNEIYQTKDKGGTWKALIQDGKVQ